MKNGKLYLQNTNFNLIGCQVGMNALYESLTAKKALFEYQIKATDFDIKRAYKEVKIFREMASAAEKAQGIVSLDYKLKRAFKRKYGACIPITCRKRSFIRKRY